MDASTTTKSGYLQPALIGGVVTGVLSALPFISGFNACCCLWVVSGGLVASYLLQQSRSTPLTPGDDWFDVLSHTRDLGEKDLTMALELAADLGLTLPLARQALQDFAASLGVPHPAD